MTRKDGLSLSRFAKEVFIGEKMSDDTMHVARSEKLALCKTFLWRWGWFIVLVMVVTTVTTALLPDSQASPSYQATLLIQSPRPDKFGLSITPLGDASTFYSSYFISPVALNLVLPKYKGWQLSDLQALVSISPVVGTNVVELIASGETAKDAVALVNDVYAAGIAAINTQRFKLVNAMISDLNQELVQTQHDAADSFSTLQSLQAGKLGSSFAYIQIDRLYKEQLQHISTVNKQLLVLQQEVLARNNTILQVVSTMPQVTTVPSTTATMGQRLALAPLIGLVMAVGGILLANTFSNKLPLRNKKEAVLSRIAAMIPLLPSSRDHLELLRQTSPCLALFRSLRYQAGERMQPLHVVTVTGAGDREGKSTVATGLAIAAAQSGLRTLLVDANVQDPILHKWFNIPNELGTLDRVQACATDGTCFLSGRPTTEEQLYFMPIGNQQLSSDILVDPLRLNGLRPLIDLLRHQADLVVFDAPTLLNDAGAINLAQLSDLTVLVVDAQKSQRSIVVEAEHVLASTNIASTIVLNRARPETIA